ncbi:hypothetical protein SNL152K_5341 [Streptomyces sp. NL15-2K]|nr:hypothetical protein SNL152K_5341 [Streptomyces sp. NL15-2K]
MLATRSRGHHELSSHDLHPQTRRSLDLFGGLAQISRTGPRIHPGTRRHGHGSLPPSLHLFGCASGFGGRSDIPLGVESTVLLAPLLKLHHSTPSSLPEHTRLLYVAPLTLRPQQLPTLRRPQLPQHGSAPRVRTGAYEVQPTPVLGIRRRYGHGGTVGTKAGRHPRIGVPYGDSEAVGLHRSEAQGVGAGGVTVGVGKQL